MLTTEGTRIFYNDESTDYFVSHVQNGLCCITKMVKVGSRGQLQRESLDLPSVYYDFFDESNIYPGSQQLEKDMIDRGYLPTE